MFTKLAWGLVAFVVIAIGRAAVFWVCMNVLGLEYETGDNVAAYYVMIATVGLVFAVIWRRLIRPA
jgi:hypothetical protein